MVGHVARVWSLVLNQSVVQEVPVSVVVPGGGGGCNGKMVVMEGRMVVVVKKVVGDEKERIVETMVERESMRYPWGRLEFIVRKK